jgi:tRNA G26 N,N-dimethylase Trm1
MSRSDYERPAWYQIEKLYKCRRCGLEQKVPQGDSAQFPCPYCRGFVERIGESYPGDSNDWDEERINFHGERDINGTWVKKK